MQQFTLTRKQVEEIYRIFKDNGDALTQVEILVESTNGIGPTMTVEYSATLDITDTENW